MKRAASSCAKSRHSSGNFVRNSLASRSINFGHSKSTNSAYLDRIRASVIATATTNTTSCFNEQRAAQHQHLLPAHTMAHSGRYLLNCMLEHQHSDRCFLLHNHNNNNHKSGNSLHLQPSQALANDHHHHHQHHHHHHHNQHQQQQLHHRRQHDQTFMAPTLSASRQLNALIDPVSHEHLMLSMMAAQGRNGLPERLSQPVGQNPSLDGKQLSDHEIALMNQHHYYFHLQQIHHQMHHMAHHQHQMYLNHHRGHHTYHHQAAAQSTNATPNGNVEQQQQQQQKRATDKESSPSEASSARCLPFEPIYSGGSQFYAPNMQLEQDYANMTANNSINQFNEHKQLNNNNNNRLVNNKNQSQVYSTSGQLMASQPISMDRSSHSFVQPKLSQSPLKQSTLR